MSLHVAHVITKLDVGGAQTHVVELALGQVQAGHRVDVIAGVDGPAANRLRTAGVPVQIVPELGASRARLSQRAALGGVTGVLRAVAPEIVHGHSSNGGLAARLAARRLKLPSVYTAHGWPFQKGATWTQRVVSYAGELVGGHLGDAVIVLTEAERARAVRARVVPARRLHVVANGIGDVPPDRRRAPLPSGHAPALIMVARFAPPKRQEELIGVLATLTDLPWTMRFVGDGPQLTTSEAMVTTVPGLAGRVDFVGHRDDVAELLAGGDVGLLWSGYEGLPISVMEYMRAGLCCVASDLPGTRELFGDQPVGLVAPGAHELASHLRDLLVAGDEIDRLGAAARGRYEAAYSVAAMVQATTAVYAHVLQGIAGGAR